MAEIKNGVINSVTLSVEDHGCLSSFVNIDYETGGQGFGGYALYSPHSYTLKSPCSLDYAGLWIWRILQVVEVGRWENLKGKSCRIKIENHLIVAIGHFYKGNWFNPGEEFKEYEERNRK